MLTQKQENFALNIYKGMTQREAWTQAGYSTNYAPELVDVHACNLAALDKVKLRLEELRQPTANAAIATVEERRERLSVFVRENINGQYGVTRHSNIQAVAELNKMGGDYAPEKHRIELDLPVNILYKLKEIKAIE